MTYDGPLQPEIIGEQYRILSFPVRKAMKLMMSYVLTEILCEGQINKGLNEELLPSYVTSPINNNIKGHTFMTVVQNLLQI